MTKLPTNWKLKKLSGSLGAEITGVTLTGASEEDIARIKQLLVEHMVLFFSAQSPSVDEQIQFGQLAERRTNLE